MLVWLCGCENVGLGVAADMGVFVWVWPKNPRKNGQNVLCSVVRGGPPVAEFKESWPALFCED